MAWKLIKAEPMEATMDDSGVYVVINRIVTDEVHETYKGKRTYVEQIVRVRADLMGTGTNADLVGDVPIVSFIGKANDVRKHLIRFIKTYSGLPSLAKLSWEHASYIGYELHRAETDPNYVQD